MSEVEQTVRGVVATILPEVPPEGVTPDRSLADLGADSVDRVEIILGILRELRIVEPLSSFNDLPNLGALITFLEARVTVDA